MLAGARRAPLAHGQGKGWAKHAALATRRVAATKLRNAKPFLTGLFSSFIITLRLLRQKTYLGSAICNTKKREKNSKRINVQENPKMKIKLIAAIYCTEFMELEDAESQGSLAGRSKRREIKTNGGDR